MLARQREIGTCKTRRHTSQFLSQHNPLINIIAVYMQERSNQQQRTPTSLTTGDKLLQCMSFRAKQGSGCSPAKKVTHFTVLGSRCCLGVVPRIATSRRDVNRDLHNQIPEPSAGDGRESFWLWGVIWEHRRGKKGRWMEQDYTNLHFLSFGGMMRPLVWYSFGMQI